MDFEHHDAGEDARAAAEIVQLAEAGWTIRPAPHSIKMTIRSANADDFDLIEPAEPTEIAIITCPTSVVPIVTTAPVHGKAPRQLGTTVITQGNIDNNHIYLRPFFDKFPEDAIDGSNMASVARREIAVDWGGATVVMTDLDGKKRFFRKRGWSRASFSETASWRAMS